MVSGALGPIFIDMKAVIMSNTAFTKSIRLDWSSPKNRKIGGAIYANNVKAMGRRGWAGSTICTAESSTHRQEKLSGMKD